MSRPPPSRVAALGVALILALTLAVIFIPRARPPLPVVLPLKAVVSPIVPDVRAWVSTADHQLTMAPQQSIDLLARPKGSEADIAIDINARYQSITGFGATMTDSSAWLLNNRMTPDQRAALLDELFGPAPGINLNMMRVTIGASDFSLDFYSLDDVPEGDTDTDLVHFNVAPILLGSIHLMQEVLAVHPGLLVVASPWSAPAWMKDSDSLIGGQLLEQYEDTYAAYLVKAVDAWQSHGVPIYALTPQNEPAFSPATYPGMSMSAETRARFIGSYLGPRLAARKSPVKILDWDHNWGLPEEPLTVLNDPVARPYVAGVAWHCYGGSQHEQGRVHRAYPDKDAWITECTGGDWPLSMSSELLWFARNLLVTGTRQWARGVLYWNLALDENHGPHLGGCSQCKGLVTIDSRTGEVTRNDEYYAVAHFSRFVEPGAVRLQSTDTDATMGVANVAFQNPSDGSVVMVAVNINTKPREVSVAQGDFRFVARMPAESVATFVWDPNPAAAWLRRAGAWVRVK